MDINNRISAFAGFGEYLLQYVDLKNSGDQAGVEFEELDRLIESAEIKNGWFTKKQTLNALKAIADNLNYEKLNAWLNNYSAEYFEQDQRQVAVILSGNIPFVGFHDLLSIVLCGHSFVAKPSSKDADLHKGLFDAMIKHINRDISKYVTFAGEKLESFDAVIATGSNNSSRYFEYYFGKYPNIIRKNRTAVAVLGGDESSEQLELLGKDVFSYYGLGCRNVSKLFIPDGFDEKLLFENFRPYGDVLNNSKYVNNYDYNKSIYLINKEEHLDNGFLLLKKDEAFVSPISSLFYETYRDVSDVAKRLNKDQEQIQCVVSNMEMNEPCVRLGMAQQPEWTDYADGVDVIKFLGELS